MLLGSVAGDSSGCLFSFPKWLTFIGSEKVVEGDKRRKKKRECVRVRGDGNKKGLCAVVNLRLIIKLSSGWSGVG